MPTALLPTDAVLSKLFHMGRTDKEIATDYGVTVQAVNKRLTRLGLFRQPVVTQVNEGLAQRWDIRWRRTEPGSHHNAHAAKSLKVWLRRRLGDKELSANQHLMADRWERRLRRTNEVLCYDSSVSGGWYYRPRQPRDGRLVVDWPSSIPFPSEEFKRALELPPEPS